MARGDALLAVGERAVDRPDSVWRAVGSAPGGRETVLPLVWVPRAEVSLGTLRTAGGDEPRVVLAAPSAAAQAAGLQPGDVLLAIGETPITGTRQAWAALVVTARRQGTPVPLTLARTGGQLVVLYDPVRRGELRFVRDPLRAWWEFLTTFSDPRYPEQAGLLPAVLPLVIVAAREALRAIPRTFREAALAVGATRWETVRHHVLPYALPGILTGTIVSLSRALGEAAPLLFLGAFLYVTYVPQGLGDSFTVLPLQIFSWATRPQDGFAAVAAAASLIILALVLLLNALAIVLRHRFQRRWSG